jgi:hypothetical protein
LIRFSYLFRLGIVPWLIAIGLLTPDSTRSRQTSSRLPQTETAFKKKIISSVTICAIDFARVRSVHAQSACQQRKIQTVANSTAGLPESLQNDKVILALQDTQSVAWSFDAQAHDHVSFAGRAPGGPRAGPL